MKKVFPLILRLIVLCFTYAFYFISEQINLYVSRTYNVSLRLLLIPLIVIIIAVLFALSVFKFRLESKVQKIIFTVAISIFSAAVLFYPISLMWFSSLYYAISVLDIFVCTAYVAELIVRRKPKTE
ncbi:MAG: hypothetical protein J1E96_07185 [Ruminococcus sp.]|nr:hypothetical protein [Ruminococcus sp.]